MRRTREFLRSLGLPGTDPGELPTSDKRFPDGARYRVEIPSVEGPEALAAVLAEADKRGVPLHRISQGSGGMLLTATELREIATSAADRQIEVSLFARPLAGWDIGAFGSTAAGAAQARGTEQLVHVLEDVRRTTDAGIRSVLLTDFGVLDVAGRMRALANCPPACGSR